MNNNLTTERALRAVFNTASYIDVGEKARSRTGNFDAWSAVVSRHRRPLRQSRAFLGEMEVRGCAGTVE